jgi:hypothetical protein
MSDVSPDVADSVPRDAALADVFPIAVRARLLLPLPKIFLAQFQSAAVM